MKSDWNLGIGRLPLLPEAADPADLWGNVAVTVAADAFETVCCDNGITIPEEPVDA